MSASNQLQIQNRTNHVAFCAALLKSHLHHLVGSLIPGETQRYQLPQNYSYNVLICSHHIDDLHPRTIPDKGIGFIHKCPTHNWILKMENNIMSVVCNHNYDPFSQSVSSVSEEEKSENE